jgi:hypothetical protein
MRDKHEVFFSHLILFKALYCTVTTRFSKFARKFSKNYESCVFLAHPPKALNAPLHNKSALVFSENLTRIKGVRW